MDWLDSNVPIALIGRDLDGLWARQQAISDNLANFETPGYQAKSVSFEEKLQDCLDDAGATRREKAETIEGVSPRVTVDSGRSERADGNSVDLEQQEIEMARTSLNYSCSLAALSDTFSRLRTAIAGK